MRSSSTEGRYLLGAAVRVDRRQKGGNSLRVARARVQGLLYRKAGIEADAKIECRSQSCPKGYRHKRLTNQLERMCLAQRRGLRRGVGRTKLQRTHGVVRAELECLVDVVPRCDALL